MARGRRIIKWGLLAGPVWLAVMIAIFGLPPSNDVWFEIVAIVVVTSIGATFSLWLILIGLERVPPIARALWATGTGRLSVASLLFGPLSFLSTVVSSWETPQYDEEWLAALSAMLGISIISFLIVQITGRAIEAFRKTP